MLAPQYFNLFEILERMGPVVYKLVLPPNIKIHNVFHISLLKKYLHDYNHVIDRVMIQVDAKG